MEETREQRPWPGLGTVPGERVFPRDGGSAGENRVQPPPWRSQEQPLERMRKTVALEERPDGDFFLHVVFRKAAASAEDAAPGTDRAEQRREGTAVGRRDGRFSVQKRVSSTVPRGLCVRDLR